MEKDLDLKILAQLQKDGRASCRQIAAALGVATTTVSHRIASLEANGTIAGYKPSIDYRHLGYQITTITLIKAKGNKIPEITEQLRKDEHLHHVYEITGEFDILAIGKFKDQESMNREIKKLLANPSIERTNTSIVLAIVKEGAPLKLLP
ncbi:Lrp/AsnC family transcriptional regulator [Candidatus Acetothermia bacterium]|nr:Lrp/AsnC family transcriptional regulator [Candidatus Acetothermia bacterium]